MKWTTAHIFQAKQFAHFPSLQISQSRGVPVRFDQIYCSLYEWNVATGERMHEVSILYFCSLPPFFFPPTLASHSLQWTMTNIGSATKYQEWRSIIGLRHWPSLWSDILIFLQGGGEDVLILISHPFARQVGQKRSPQKHIMTNDPVGSIWPFLHTNQCNPSHHSFIWFTLLYTRLFR